MISSIRGLFLTSFNHLFSICSQLVDSIKNVANRMFVKCKPVEQADSLVGRLSYYPNREALDQFLEKGDFATKQAEIRAAFKTLVLGCKPALAESLLLSEKTGGFLEGMIPVLFDELLHAPLEEGTKNAAYYEMLSYLALKQNQQAIRFDRLELAILKAIKDKDLLLFDSIMRSNSDLDEQENIARLSKIRAMIITMDGCNKLLSCEEKAVLEALRHQMPRVEGASV